MPPKRFEGKFGIPPSHSTESELTSALYRLPEGIDPQRIDKLAEEIVAEVDVELGHRYQAWLAEHGEGAAAPLQALSAEHVQTLQLKLARHFEHTEKDEHLNIPVLVDALLETPRFLENDKGSIEKLHDIHHVKSLQRSAELRRKRAEMTGKEELNPYEALFETSSGDYYLARLLNMPHLEQESEDLGHCVGLEDTYINRIKRGEVEILSLRQKRDHSPVVTIEYDLKHKTLRQVRGGGDESPKLGFHRYIHDLIEALERLPQTATDTGELRVIASNEVRDARKILTIHESVVQGKPLSRADLIFLYEIDTPIAYFNDEEDQMVAELLGGRDDHEDLPVLFDCAPEDIARSVAEITESTKAYIGPLEPGIFDRLSETVEHIYTFFPNERVKFHHIELGTSIKDGPALEKALALQNMNLGYYAKHHFKNSDFTTLLDHRHITLVEVTAASLSFLIRTEYDTICRLAQEVGLDLCPIEVGPQLRLQYKDQPQGGWLAVAMRPIEDESGDTGIFTLYSNDDGLSLGMITTDARTTWSPDTHFIFLRPAKEPQVTQSPSR